jgi:demethylmenaquinone methyltransferase / 2-methoxy-6-polyprenyl-1,4-benzoquinol methylase
MDRDTLSQRARIPQSDVPKLYDGLARFYDTWGNLTESRARKRAFVLAAVQDGQDILEVAVGTGLVFLDVVRANPSGRNAGIDLSPGMLAKAKKRLRASGCTNYELSTGTAFEIDEEAASFDTLLNSYMFDLIDERDWPRILSEFRRVLRPGGRLVLVGMTRGERFGSGIYERLYRLSPRLMGGCRGVQLAGPLEESGFVIESRSYVQQMLFPSEVILALKSADAPNSG